MLHVFEGMIVSTVVELSWLVVGLVNHSIHPAISKFLNSGGSRDLEKGGGGSRPVF